MSDNSRVMPKALVLRFDGYRGGYHITASSPNMLVDGKLDRDVVLRGGRMPEDVRFFELIADDKPVARLTHDEKNWTISLLNEKGSETEKISVARSETKRAQRKESAKPARIDPGSDLHKAVTFVVGKIWPNVSSISTGTRNNQKVRLAQAQNVILDLARELAATRGIDFTEFAKERNLTLPESE